MKYTYLFSGTPHSAWFSEESRLEMREKGAATVRREKRESRNEKREERKEKGERRRKKREDRSGKGAERGDGTQREIVQLWRADIPR